MAIKETAESVNWWSLKCKFDFRLIEYAVTAGNDGKESQLFAVVLYLI